MGDGISQETGSEDIRKRMSLYLAEVGGGHKTSRSLSLKEAEEAFRYIFEGKSSEAQTAAFLIALRIKGSSDEERLGLLNILRQYNEEAGFNFPDLLDYSNFYDGRDNEIQLSPVIALVAVAAGARVVMTGGKAKNNNIMNRITIQDVLKGLGIRVNASLPEVGEHLQNLRIGFIDTHDVNRALNNPDLDRIREDIGLRTPINTIEVSLNPAKAPYQIRGMFHPGNMEQVAKIMAVSGIKRGMMLGGISGSGEVPTYKTTKGFEITGERVAPFSIDPSEYGFSPGDRSHIMVSDILEQTGKLLEILDGKGEASLRDMTILNAALILYTSEKARSIDDGIKMSAECLNSGKPLRLLNAWKKI